MEKLPSLFIIILSLSIFSCLKDKTVPISDCDTIISYSEEVRPIIESSCKTGGGSGCHDAWIDDFSQVSSAIASQDWPNAVFVAQTMPKFPNAFGIDSLTAEEFKTMKCWIDQGYPEN